MFTLKFDTDNSAFDGEHLAGEIANCLVDLAERLREQSRAYLVGNGSRTYIKDSNGNTVGFCNIECEVEEEDAE